MSRRQYGGNRNSRDQMVRNELGVWLGQRNGKPSNVFNQESDVIGVVLYKNLHGCLREAISKTDF